MAIPIRRGSTRRTFITGGALGAAALLVTPSRSDARDRTAAEKANVKIVNDFCDSWVSHDPEKIASFMADDCSTRLSETQPPAKGRAALIEQLKGLFQRLEEVEIEVRVFPRQKREDRGVDRLRAAKRVQIVLRPTTATKNQKALPCEGQGL